MSSGGDRRVRFEFSITDDPQNQSITRAIAGRAQQVQRDIKAASGSFTREAVDLQKRIYGQANQAIEQSARKSANVAKAQHRSVFQDLNKQAAETANRMKAVQTGLVGIGEGVVTTSRSGIEFLGSLAAAAGLAEGNLQKVLNVLVAARVATSGIDVTKNFAQLALRVRDVRRQGGGGLFGSVAGGAAGGLGATRLGGALSRTGGAAWSLALRGLLSVPGGQTLFGLGGAASIPVSSLASGGALGLGVLGGAGSLAFGGGFGIGQLINQLDFVQRGQRGLGSIGLFRSAAANRFTDSVFDFFGAEGSSTRDFSNVAGVESRFQSRLQAREQELRLAGMEGDEVRKILERRKEEHNIAKQAAESRLNTARKELDVARQIVEERKREVQEILRGRQSAGERFASLSPVAQQSVLNLSRRLRRGERLNADQLSILSPFRELGDFDRLIGGQFARIAFESGFGQLLGRSGSNRQLELAEFASRRAERNVRDRERAVSNVERELSTLDHNFDRLIGTLERRFSAINRQIEELSSHLQHAERMGFLRGQGVR